jgi:hypothetical protein
LYKSVTHRLPTDWKKVLRTKIMWMWIDGGILCDAQCRDISLFIEKRDLPGFENLAGLRSPDIWGEFEPLLPGWEVERGWRCEMVGVTSR